MLRQSVTRSDGRAPAQHVQPRQPVVALLVLMPWSSLGRQVHDEQHFEELGPGGHIVTRWHIGISLCGTV